MKKTLAILTFIALISSCSDKNEQEFVCAIRDEEVKKSDPNSYEYRDSIYAQNVWYFCQGLINSNKQKNYFLGNTDTTRFENNGRSEIYGIVEITSAFNPKRKFARVRRISTSGFTYIDIIDLSNDSAIIQEKHWGGNYLGDTIIDCNNDGYSDYVVKLMTSSGCCPREDSWIYLYNPERNKFESPINFLNVTYFTNQKEIIGMSYGHLGETYLYKIRFNRLSADTIEFLHHHPNDVEKYILSKSDEVDLRKDILLAKVPGEYKKAEGYFWFIGELNAPNTK